MAKCEEGYLCDVCGGDVEEITDSDLYLRYVIGMLDPETLHTTRERHIRCNPVLAQFIVDDDFAPVVVEGDFDKRRLDPAYVHQRETLVTRGWRRLRELAGSGAADHRLPAAGSPRGAGKTVAVDSKKHMATQGSGHGIRQFKFDASTSPPGNSLRTRGCRPDSSPR